MIFLKRKNNRSKTPWEKVPFYKPIKSKESEDGYLGRIGIHEILQVTSSIREMIIRGTSQDEIEEQAKKKE